MTQQIINVGAAPNDGTGDPLRVSFDKCNQNFTELYQKGAATGAEGVWNFNKTSSDTATSPVSGRFKTNSGDYRNATQIAIHAITVDGIDRSDTLRSLLAKDLIQVQDTSNGAAWARYVLQSVPTNNATWFQLNVAWQADGNVLSGDNQEILFTFTANLDLSHIYMRWVPYTGAGQAFLSQDTTRDGDWSMVAVNDTTDRPAPQATGAEEDLLPIWTPATQSNPANYTVYNEWTVNVSGWIDQYGADILNQNIGKQHVITLTVNGVVKDTFTTTPNTAQLYLHDITPLVVASGAVIRVTNAVSGSGSLSWWQQPGLFATAPVYCSSAAGSKDGAAAGTTAYACHLLFTPGTKSPNWDVLAYGGAAAGGGGGGGAPVNPSPLTIANDTNVTLTLGGTPATALLQATSITAGWTGTLANARLANMNGNTIKGNNTGAAAAPIDLTGTQATALLDLFTSAAKGLAPSSGGGTTNFLRADGTWNAPAGGPTPIPNYLGGLTLSNDATTPNTVLDIATGAACSDDNATMMTLGSPITKSISATWAVGNAAGGLDTGTVAANTWYHVFLIQRTDTNVVDVLISTSAITPTLPSPYNKKRRIGSIKTNASSQIIGFVQNGDEFLWVTPITIYNNASVGTVAGPAYTGAPNIKTVAIFTALLNTANAGVYLTFWPSDQSGVTGINVPSGNIQLWVQAATQYAVAPYCRIRSDTNGAMMVVCSADTLGFYLVSHGWVDNRGK
jgi:hypothetical protein